MVSRMWWRNQWGLSTRIVSCFWHRSGRMLLVGWRYGSRRSSVGRWWSTHGHISCSLGSSSVSSWSSVVRSMRVGSRKSRWRRSLVGPWGWWSCMHSWPCVDGSRRSVRRPDPHVSTNTPSIHFPSRPVRSSLLRLRSCEFPRLPRVCSTCACCSLVATHPTSRKTGAFACFQLFFSQDELPRNRRCQRHRDVFHRFRSFSNVFFFIHASAFATMDLPASVEGGGCGGGGAMPQHDRRFVSCLVS